MMCLGQQNLDRIAANAERAEALDRELGIERVKPEERPRSVVYAKDDFSRDAEDEG